MKPVSTHGSLIVVSDVLNRSCSLFRARFFRLLRERALATHSRGRASSLDFPPQRPGLSTASRSSLVLRTRSRPMWTNLILPQFVVFPPSQTLYAGFVLQISLYYAQTDPCVLSPTANNDIGVSEGCLYTVRILHKHELGRFILTRLKHCVIDG